MNRVRVAFFAEILVEDFDGASRTMFQLIKRINRAEFDFLFICGVGPDSLYGFDCIRTPSVTLPVNTTYKMALPALAENQVKKKLNAFAPDVVHIATPSLLGNFALKYARQRGIPVLTIYHTHFISYIDYYFKYAPILASRIKPMVAGSQRSFYNQCDVIYVPSESIREELGSMGIDRGRMMIWKRGIDTGLFSPDKRNVEFIRKVTGSDRPVVLFASRLVWEKNLETLFRIYDLMDEAGMPVTFLVAGDGIARKAAESRMKKAVFTGKVNHETLSAVYASSDIFLFPSVSETCGNVVLEAMASGLPCIIAEAGGSQDFIEAGISGFKCSPYDEKDYVARMMLLLSDRQLMEQFKKEGVELSRKFCWKQLAFTYFSELKKLAARQLLEVV